MLWDSNQDLKELRNLRGNQIEDKETPGNTPSLKPPKRKKKG
jgi:hypothetical protein